MTIDEQTEVEIGIQTIPILVDEDIVVAKPPTVTINSIQQIKNFERIIDETLKEKTLASTRINRIFYEKSNIVDAVRQIEATVNNQLTNTAANLKDKIKKLVLDKIQRDFVNDENGMKTLFSVLINDSLDTIKVSRKTEEDFISDDGIAYHFVVNYEAGTSHKRPKFTISISADKFETIEVIFDGQQRLTMLAIFLIGTYHGKIALLDLDSLEMYEESCIKARFKQEYRKEGKGLFFSNKDDLVKLCEEKNYIPTKAIYTFKNFVHGGIFNASECLVSLINTYNVVVTTDNVGDYIAILKHLYDVFYVANMIVKEIYEQFTSDESATHYMNLNSYASTQDSSDRIRAKLNHYTKTAFQNDIINPYSIVATKYANLPRIGNNEKPLIDDKSSMKYALRSCIAHNHKRKKSLPNSNVANQFIAKNIAFFTSFGYGEGKTKETNEDIIENGDIYVAIYANTYSEYKTEWDNAVQQFKDLISFESNNSIYSGFSYLNAMSDDDYNKAQHYMVGLFFSQNVLNKYHAKQKENGSSKTNHIINIFGDLNNKDNIDRIATINKKLLKLEKIYDNFKSSETSNGYRLLTLIGRVLVANEMEYNTKNIQWAIDNMGGILKYDVMYDINNPSQIFYNPKLSGGNIEASRLLAAMETNTITWIKTQADHIFPENIMMDHHQVIDMVVSELNELEYTQKDGTPFDAKSYLVMDITRFINTYYDAPIFKSKLDVERNKAKGSRLPRDYMSSSIKFHKMKDDYDLRDYTYTEASELLAPYNFFAMLVWRNKIMMEKMIAVNAAMNPTVDYGNIIIDTKFAFEHLLKSLKISDDFPVLYDFLVKHRRIICKIVK